ncbi:MULTISPECIES: hypothetical protein [Cellulosimicrobium]|uniref:hypothetical protein n=1 Tax=Cellulosimicrobium TaxID=157920 RepID=UPI0012E25670|nr:MULTISPECIES: hypothetical protein [Cellulosimicrobium]
MVLAVLAGGVPTGEALSYGIVLAIVSVPVCALVGAAIGGLFVFVRTRSRSNPVARPGGSERTPGAGGGPGGHPAATLLLTADDVLAIPGVASVDVTRVEPGLEDLYVRFDDDPDGERDVVVLHNTSVGSALALVDTARLELDEKDLRALLESVGARRFRVERGNRIVVWHPSGDEQVFV